MKGHRTSIKGVGLFPCMWHQDDGAQKSLLAVVSEYTFIECLVFVIFLTEMSSVTRLSVNSCRNIKHIFIQVLELSTDKCLVIALCFACEIH